MLGPALPFRPNAITIRGTACIWWDAALQVDAWIRHHEKQAPLYGTQASMAAPTDRERFAEYLERGSKTLRHRVWALPPERSRIEFENEDSVVRDRVTVVNENGHSTWFETDQGVMRHGQRWSSNQEKRESQKFWNAGHENPAAALILPRVLFRGLSPIPDSTRDVRWNDRLAHQIDFVRMIAAGTQESIATDDIPNHEFDGADRVEFVIDNERNIILEWRCVFEEQIYRRFWFEDLEFDPPLDQSLFDIDAGPKPPPVIDNRPAKPPEAAIVDEDGTPLQQGMLLSWRWLIDGKPSVHYPLAPNDLPVALPVDRSIRFDLNHPVPPNHCTVHFSRVGDPGSFCPIPAVPQNAIVSGIDKYGVMSREGSSIRIDMPLPAESGHYEVKLSCGWLAPFNSPEPPDSDVPHFGAFWLFAVESSGNEDGPPFDLPRTQGFSFVLPNLESPETAT